MKSPNFNELIKPSFLIEKRRCDAFLYFEYLKNASEDELMEIAKKIDNLNISNIDLVWLYDNDIFEGDLRILKYLNKDKIKTLHIHTNIDFSMLNEFHNLKSTGLYLLTDQILTFDNMIHLENLTITGYHNNIDFNKLNPNLNHLHFWKYKNNIFNYDLYLKHVSSLNFSLYKCVNLNKVHCKSIKCLSIYGAKQIDIDINHRLLETIEVLDLNHCNISSFITEVFKRMVNLKELRLQNCDLTNITTEVFKTLTNLKIMVLDSCTSLQTLQGLGHLDRVCLWQTKVLDNDTSPLFNVDDVFITNSKTYNYKNKDLPKKANN